MYRIRMVIAFSIMIGMNILSNVLPLNGQTMSEISNRLQVPFTPAGYVFSIWSIIYILLAIWVFLAFRNKGTKRAPSQKVVLLFITSCFLNAGWIVSFHYEFFILSTVIMVALLCTMILIYRSYPIGNFRFSERLPFSIYLGWISVATIANISYTLTSHSIDLGINKITGTIILVCIAGALGVFGRYYSNDPYFALVFVWAIVGIAQENRGTPLETAAYIVAVIIFVAIVLLTFRPRRTQWALP